MAAGAAERPGPVAAPAGSDAAGSAGSDAVPAAADAAPAGSDVVSAGSGHAGPVVVEVVRSGFVESRHTAALVALGADGSLLLSAGDLAAPVFPRSANKPLQAAVMLDCGLDLDGELLALACASHSGEPFHVAGVRRILAAAGLGEAALDTPPDWPLDRAAARAHARAGGGPEPVLMNCSGKHAAMLATCVAAGWPTRDYRDPRHPLQQALRRGVADLAGEPVTAVGVDGCGAPLFALTLPGLARAFARLATAAPETAAGRVAAAVRAHPEHVGGTGRDVTRFLRAVPGLVAKDGAEGVYAAALVDGRAVARKVLDGADRPRPALLAAALTRLGVTGLDDLGRVPVLGHGEPVGELRVVGLPDEGQRTVKPAGAAAAAP